MEPACWNLRYDDILFPVLDWIHLCKDDFLVGHLYMKHQQRAERRQETEGRDGGEK